MPATKTLDRIDDHMYATYQAYPQWIATGTQGDYLLYASDHQEFVVLIRERRVTVFSFEGNLNLN